MTDTGHDALLALIEQLQQTMTARETALHQRIADLETTLARLTPRLDEPHATTIDVPAVADDPDTGLSRRRLIRMAGAGAAVGIAAVGATVAAATPAAADPNNPLVIGVTNAGASTITAITASPGPNSSTFAATNTNGDRPIGLYGVAGDTSGMQVFGGAVVGNSHDQYGVVGFSSTGRGVAGYSTSDCGVSGRSGTNAGLFGASQDGIGAEVSSINNVGVSATSENDVGVYASSNALHGTDVAAVVAKASYIPAVIAHSDTTHGVIGLAQGATLGNVTTSGLLGQATSARGVTGAATTGTGVAGQAGAGIGVSGTAAATGIAAQFSGGRAQLYLVPATTTGHPTTGTHKIGELFLDKTSALYLCKTAGTPGTWKLLG